MPRQPRVCGKGCGKIIRSRNQSGICRNCQTKTRRCADCETPIRPQNVHGLCAQCYKEARKQILSTTQRADALVMLRAGHTQKEVAAAMGVKPHHISELAIDHNIGLPTRRLADIIAAALDVSGVDRAVLMSPLRKRQVSTLRHAIAIVGKECGQSLTRIGTALGRDHSSVLNGQRKAADRMRRDPDFAALVQAIRDWRPVERVAVEQVAPPVIALPPVVAPKPVTTGRNCLPRNNFDSAADTADNGHTFHRSMARASADFGAALRRAMAA